MSDASKYKLTVGIETHVQLKTKSKLFSGADNETLDAEPNTLVNHIDFGLPGALPVLNKQAIELASKAAFALNSRPQAFSKFDRKHYFYPDLPMGYQITQFDEPIIIGGYVEYLLEGETNRVNITRAHIESDAGKSVHSDGSDYSLVDLNRAGTPLLEIVSEPEMHSSSEARAYARELYLLMRLAGVSNANLYYGNMRFDVNVSISATDELGTRTETKNLNSFRSVERAIEFEKSRQIELLEKGQEIVQETRGWNDAKGRGYSMRTKENADDYRYMPDPDLPPVELDEAYISSVESTVAKLPNYWREALAKYNLDSSIIESLIEGEVEYSFDHLQYLASVDGELAKNITNWIVNIELPLRRKLSEEAKEIKLSSEDIHRAYEEANKLYKDSRLSSTNVKELLNKLLVSDSTPKSLEDYATREGLMQESDEGKLSEIVDQVLKDNPKAVEDVKAGEEKAVGFLVGQVMKLSKGQANPSVVNELLKSKTKV